MSALCGLPPGSTDSSPGPGDEEGEGESPNAPGKQASWAASVLPSKGLRSRPPGDQGRAWLRKQTGAIHQPGPLEVPQGKTRALAEVRHHHTPSPAGNCWHPVPVLGTCSEWQGLVLQFLLSMPPPHPAPSPYMLSPPIGPSFTAQYEHALADCGGCSPGHAVYTWVVRW